MLCTLWDPIVFTFVEYIKYKATCFDYNLAIFRPTLTFVLPGATHTLRSHRVYTMGSRLCPVRLHSIFPHYLINGMIFPESIL